MDEQGLETLGVRLLADAISGATRLTRRSPDRATRFVAQIIITRASVALLGGGSARQARLRHVGRPATVIGVIDNMLGSWPIERPPDWVFSRLG